jgi:hypothetical protein
LFIEVAFQQFTAWTTFTDGTLIGVDESLTTSYLATLAMFASLSVTQGVKGDGEVRNRLVIFDLQISPLLMLLP